jgi:hypothetical protein
MSQSILLVGLLLLVVNRIACDSCVNLWDADLTDNSITICDGMNSLF